MLCCVTESNDVISFNLGGVFTERGAFLAKVVQEQLQPSTTHPGGIRLCIFLHLVYTKESSKKHGDGIFEYLMTNLLLLQIATEGKSIAFSWLKTKVIKSLTK